MNVTQTVEIPPNRQLFVEVPQEVPAGKAILTYSTISTGEEIDNIIRISSDNHINLDELKAKLQKLQGSLGKTAFCAMNGITYQRMIRDEWDN